MFFLLEPTLYAIYQPVFTSWFSTRYSHSDLTDRPSGAKRSQGTVVASDSLAHL